jgi:hypothetical protein
VFANVLSRTDRAGTGRPAFSGYRAGRHLIGMNLIARRSRRQEAEAAEVAEIDTWLAKMRSGPEMVLYPAHPASLTPARPPAPANPARRGKKRRK